MSQLKELEAAARIVLASPNIISAEQRQSAEAVFLNFRKTNSPYQLCQQILESNTIDYVLFETAGLMRTAIIRESSYLSLSDMYTLIEYLQDYIITKLNLTPYVRAKILQVLAILIKIVSSQDSGQQRRKVLNFTESLIRGGDLSKQILGCEILSAILQEYATNTKSSDIGQTWEWHFKEKMEFEKTDMKQLFKFCLKVLTELTEKLFEEEILPFVKHILAIAESMLAWKYFLESLPKKLARLCTNTDSGENPPLMLSSVWRDIILEPVILNVFFMMYLKVRNNPQIAHYAMNCLVQLSSLHGSVISTDNDKVTYLTNYMERFLTLVRSIEISKQEVNGITNIIRKINCFFRSSFSSLPEVLYISYMQEVTRLTCLFINYGQEKSMHNDDLYIDAMERLLGTLLNNFYPNTQLSEMYSSEIFHTYVLYRLSIHEDTEDKTEEITEMEENDRVKFNNQLEIIGAFGRQAASYTLPLLAEFLEERIQKLCNNLNILVEQNNLSSSRPVSIDDLYDELHWLVLIAGYILSVDSDGVPLLIPIEITRCSMNQSRNQQVNIECTLKFLLSSQNVGLILNHSTQSVDYVVRLIANVFRLCTIEKTLISMNLQNIISPELNSTITWFLNRILQSYILPYEVSYTEISTTILQVFGEDSPAASWVLNFLLDRILCNIMIFKNEPEIIKQTTQLLISLVETKNKASYLLRSKQFKSIIDLAMKTDSNCPQIVRRGLMRTMIEIAATLQDLKIINNGNDKNDAYLYKVEETFYSQILQSLSNRYKQLTINNRFKSSYHEENVRIQIIDILDSFMGVTEGVKNSTIQLVFQHTYHVIVMLPKLLLLYHNYEDIVQLILELLCEHVKTILSHLSEADTMKVYQTCLETIRIYVQCNSNRFTIDPTAEEDSYRDIFLLMRLLTHFLNMDIFNLIDKQNESRVKPVEVFFDGLNMIMPLITTDLLKFPSVCSQYFKMISFACDICPEKICNLPTKLLQQCLTSIELGLYSFGTDVITLCCDAIQAISKHIYLKMVRMQSHNDTMLPFLNLLMQLILSGQMDSDSMPSADLPLYYLICCYQQQYKEIVNNIIQSQTNRQLISRLTQAFQQLTWNVEFDNQRIHKARFRDNFEQFVTLVQGFLMIK